MSAAQIGAQRRNRRARSQRNHEQKAESGDQPETGCTGPQHQKDGLIRSFDLPSLVQAGLHLAETPEAVTKTIIAPRTDAVAPVLYRSN